MTETTRSAALLAVLATLAVFLLWGNWSPLRGGLYGLAWLVVAGLLVYRLRRIPSDSRSTAGP